MAVSGTSGQFLGVRVTGAKALRRQIKLANSELAKDALKEANRSGAERVRDEAKRLAPVDTGKLQKSIRASGTLTRGVVRAGNKRVPYANIVHWGTPVIPENTYLFDAADNEVSKVLEEYEQAVDNVLAILAASSALKE